MDQIAIGRRARVRVPATSANLGPGFDCMGLALGWTDELSVEVVIGEHVFDLEGEGADQVPRDETHLVVKTLLRALAELGADPVHVRLETRATIPLSRGLGSSAAAIVAGLALAWELARPGQELDTEWACSLSTRIEGHPDNACAAVLGGIILAWTDDQLRVARLDAADGLLARVWVPGNEVPTSGARGVLPQNVAHSAAVAQATCSALLVHALTADPSRLLTATQDRLHQPYRAALMPSSAQLVDSLRANGVPAMISGAGPTVIALGTRELLSAADAVAAEGFAIHSLSIGGGVAIVR